MAKNFFEKKFSSNSYVNVLADLTGELDNRWKERIDRINNAWNFYEGYHWEDVDLADTPEITVNYCRAFVNKFTSFELGKAFSFTTHSATVKKSVTDDGRDLFGFLEDVWEDNNQYKWCIEMGQLKNVTGEAWTRVAFKGPDEVFDPFGEYKNGRVELLLMPTSVIFPEFNPHDASKLDKLTVLYVYKRRVTSWNGQKETEEDTIFRQIWTDTEVITQDGDNEVRQKNKYGVIPFVQIKNLSQVGRNEGVGDLDDIIPLNVEYNMKQSNVSEIIDYHSAPITVVYGAQIGNLEKGANKVWGGIPKDAKVENLELKGDGGTAKDYIANLKLSMCEVGNIPETVLGGSQAISNTSGVALQYINLPLIERTRMKIMNTEDGLERLNKMIILVSICEGLITKPEDVPNRDFFHTECDIPDTLPKDVLIELQQLSMEMTMGIEDREGAMKRLGRENIDEKLKKIDKDRAEHPEIYGGLGGTRSTNGNPSLNSGMTNGETPAEHIRTALNGKNGND